MRSFVTAALLLVAATAASKTWTRVAWSKSTHSYGGDVMCDAYDSDPAFAYTFAVGWAWLTQRNMTDGAGTTLMLPQASEYSFNVKPLIVKGVAYIPIYNVLNVYPNTTWASSTQPTWNVSLPCNISATAYGAGRLYAGCSSGYVFALSPADGSITWAASVPVNSQDEQQLLFVAGAGGDTLVVRQFSVTALDAASGDQRWNETRAAATTTISSPVVASPDGALTYIVTMTPPGYYMPPSVTVKAVSTLTGVVVWTAAPQPSITNTPEDGTSSTALVATDGAVIVGFSYDGTQPAGAGFHMIFGIDATTGHAMWNASYPMYGCLDGQGMSRLCGPVTLTPALTVNDHSDVVVCQLFNCSGVSPMSGRPSAWRYGVASYDAYGHPAVQPYVLQGYPNTLLALVESDDDAVVWERIDITLPVNTPAPANFAVVKRCPGATTCTGATCGLATTILGCNGNGTKAVCGANGESLRLEYFSTAACTGRPASRVLLLKDVCTIEGSAASELISC